MKTLLLCLLLLHLPVQALDWNQLSDEEQRILLPFADQWDQMEENQQQQLIKGARAWLGMTPEQRRQARERLRHWQQLPADKRQRIREKYRQFRKLPQEERQRLLRARKRFEQLPPEKRQALRQRFRNMSAQERRQFIRRLGQRPPRPQVPADERERFDALAGALPVPLRGRLFRALNAASEEKQAQLRQKLYALDEEERIRFIENELPP